MSTFMIGYDPEIVSISSILNIVETSVDRHVVPFEGTVLLKTPQSLETVLSKLRTNGIPSLITPVAKHSLDGVSSDWPTIHRSVF